MRSRKTAMKASEAAPIRISPAGTSHTADSRTGPVSGSGQSSKGRSLDSSEARQRPDQPVRECIEACNEQNENHVHVRSPGLLALADRRRAASRARDSQGCEMYAWLR